MEAPSCSISGWVRESLNHRISELESALVREGEHRAPDTLRLHSGEVSHSAVPWLVTVFLGPTISFIGPGFIDWLTMTRFTVNWHINSTLYICIFNGGYSISVTRIPMSLIQCWSMWEIELVHWSLLSNQSFREQGWEWPWTISYLCQAPLANCPCPTTGTFGL